MAEIKGKMMVCDRCGEELFIKEKCPNETDRAFSSQRFYDDVPSGWNHQDVSKDCKHSDVLLCPECNHLCESLLRDFMGGRMTLEE
jgi:hypothetical protein